MAELKSWAWTDGIFGGTVSAICNVPAADGAKPAKFEPPKTGVSASMTFDRTCREAVWRSSVPGSCRRPNAEGGVIDDGVILIERDGIKAMGNVARSMPAGTLTLDVKGRTIIPGLVDAHAHGPYGIDELTPQQNWTDMVNLALGVTTRHDPSSSAATVFPALEMERAGLIVGPRTFSTGEIIWREGPEVYAQIDGLDDARACPSPQGAGRAQRQKLQSAAPGAAPASRCGRSRRKHALGCRRRFVVRARHDPDR
ncbi:MAG: hypothetical protein IPP45_14960 [Sphingomonadales bacterium]|nr:hypothetical protein [Sphingomonadales bacterium]